MPDTENPRSYIRPVPLPIPSHQGLKITARNAKFYTCEVPTRKEVARENYERRRHQMSKCGYRSVIYKPYQPVGEVFLDDRKLILSALGQEQTEQENQVYNIVTLCTLTFKIKFTLLGSYFKMRVKWSLFISLFNTLENVWSCFEVNLRTLIKMYAKFNK